MPIKIAEIKNLTLKKGQKTLQSPISFTWERGQQWCVTGPTGSGKTTLLKILSGQLFAPGADISFPYLEYLKQKSSTTIYLSEMIGYVPQEVKIPSGYIEDLYYQRRFQATEQDDIPTTKEILLRSTHQDELKTLQVSKLMGLSSLLQQPFLQLSNGQTRKLMIAIALTKSPKILFLDHPFIGLDMDARKELIEQIKKLIHNGLHIFIAAHTHEIESMDFITHQIELKEVYNFQNNQPLPKSFDIPLSSANETIIEMDNVQVKYDKKIIFHIPHWIVQPTERWVIQGKNGSGKSTLLSIIMADHPQAYSNHIQLFNKKRGTGESIWDIKKKIGYFSPEQLRFFETHHTCEEVIASGWSDYIGHIPILTAERKSLVNILADWLDIAYLKALRFGDLSLGQQKMILIARAMFKNPELLILDEPLQGMDIKSSAFFKQKINEFAINRTILYVTHDKDEIPEGEWKHLLL
ncbi:MAG: ATP-binding cassette domain-containing protein [Chitinophagales bacterium]|nr:ATP-binding cassette domain-containing protein [Chitinophagales bacterium]MCZ2393829.1 ATP-binding cassette domain-containing protein [Chitinophagales bacterium]